MLAPAKTSRKIVRRYCGFNLIPEQKPFFNSPVYLALIFPALYLTHRQEPNETTRKEKIMRK